ncbi:MAG: hypothetical protein ACRENC_19875 [Gemmatimonadaceae bacterium]
MKHFVLTVCVAAIVFATMPRTWGEALERMSIFCLRSAAVLIHAGLALHRDGYDADWDDYPRERPHRRHNDDRVALCSTII